MAGSEVMSNKGAQGKVALDQRNEQSATGGGPSRQEEQRPRG